MIVLCAALAGLAVALALPTSAGELLSRRTGQLGGVEVRPASMRSGRLPAVVGWTCAGAAVLVGPPSGGPALAGLLLVPLGVTSTSAALRRRRAARAAAGRRAGVVEAAAVLAGELRAGRTPSSALDEAATACPQLRGAVAAAALGGDVASALAAAGRAPGAEGLAVLAAGWRLTARTGAPLALLVTRAASAVRTEDRLRSEVATALAPVRSTTGLLALLPVATVGLGIALGADPVHVLLGTPWGGACGLAALALAALGSAWVRRIVDSATRSPWRP